MTALVVLAGAFSAALALAIVARLSKAAKARLEATRRETEARLAEISARLERVEGERKEAEAQGRAVVERYETVREVGSSLEPEATFAHLASAARRFFDADLAIFVPEGIEGLPPGYHLAQVEPAEASAWQAALEGSEVVRHSRLEGRHSRLEGRHSRLEGRTAGGERKRFLPVRSGEATLAVLRLAGPSDAVETSAEEREKTRTFLTQAALALEKIRLYKVLERESRTDLMTGLANRGRFDEVFRTEFERAKASGSPLALVIADVDRFKSFNDTYGHRIGDQVLVAVGEALRGSARETDFVARYGGEEFVVLLPGTTTEAGGRAAERFRRAVEAREVAAVVSGSTERLRVTASFGVAAYPEDGRTPEEVLSRADAALYRAKEMGRNRVVVFAGGSPARGAERTAEGVG